MSGAGPGCGHDLCLFERDCLVIQAEAELDAVRDDRMRRRDTGRSLAHSLGLGDDEGRLLEVIAYSPSLESREAAGAFLVRALERLATPEAA